MKAIEQHFPVVPFISYFIQDGSNFESLNETLKCDHSNESYQAVLCCGAIHILILPKWSFKNIC